VKKFWGETDHPLAANWGLPSVAPLHDHGVCLPVAAGGSGMPGQRLSASCSYQALALRAGLALLVYRAAPRRKSHGRVIPDPIERGVQLEQLCIATYVRWRCAVPSERTSPRHRLTVDACNFCIMHQFETVCQRDKGIHHILARKRRIGDVCTVYTSSKAIILFFASGRKPFRMVSRFCQAWHFWRYILFFNEIFIYRREEGSSSGI
jgi:hypothetical protein